MKEKPSKPGKSSKKKQVEQPVELTPKQLKEKRREEARAKAAVTRKIVAAGAEQWTGKLPGHLLNEHVQKMKWRLNYRLKTIGQEPDQTYMATAVLSRTNPKTKESDTVTFNPPADRIEPQKDQFAARHFTATYTLHRILPNRNMKMLLPPAHKDLWVKLDEDKANAKPHEAHKWHEDPFLMQQEYNERKKKNIETSKQRQQIREQREIVSEARSTQPSYARKVKFNNTLVISKKMRSVVEEVIRENNGFRFSTKDGLSASEENYEKLLNMLKKLGFRENYAKESLEYASSLSGALTWLLVHVPEDDVPKSFMPTDLSSVARLSSGIKIETTASRLQNFGYSEDLSHNTSNRFAGDLGKSVIQLSRSLAMHSQQDDSKVNEDGGEFWDEEVESLQALLEPNEIDVSAGACKLTMKKWKIYVTFFKSPNYPNEVPGVAIEPIESGKISKLTQLELTRQTILMMSSQLVGDYMLMLSFQHVEEIFKSVVDNPPKLAQLSSGISGVDESFRLKNADRNAKSNNTKAKSAKRALEFNPAEVAKERDERMSTSDGKSMLSSRAGLPAWEKRNEIVELVQKHQVTLITGETGSGKSTQTVQFILDAIPDAQILCTQPRRISAIGVAQRVADERLVKIGDQVGYIIRGEAKMSKKTQLRFVTTGVLLRMLHGQMQNTLQDDLADLNIVDKDAAVEENGLNGITHIFVDEVHERSLDGDFLLILLKRLLAKAPKIKIILMSATVDQQQFFNYFKPREVGYTHITGRTFPVKKYYLGDVLTTTGYRPISGRGGQRGNDDVDLDDGGEKLSDDDDISIGKIMAEIRRLNPGRIDYNLVGTVVEYIHKKLLSSGDSNGSILVFMTGAAEIDQAIKAIDRTESGSSLWSLPLHASLPPAEQRKVFQKAPRGLRKVICSTNVAETSITISDIVAVVDSGRVKETVYDPEANASRLIDIWTSQSSATQRMGRAGRVRAGECYKLYTENTEETRMPVKPLPEILRSPLEVLYLTVKSMGVNNVAKFMSMAIDPPEDTALENAKNNLISYGAIDESDNLTSLGKHISMIPTDPKTAKLLVLSTMLGCLPNCLTVAAVHNLGKRPFAKKWNDDTGFNDQLFQDFGGENGDLVASCVAYNLWTEDKHDRNQVNNNVCRDIRSTRTQLLNSLISIGFIEPNAVKSKGRMEEYPESLCKYNNDFSTVRAVISASIRPNIVEAVSPPGNQLPGNMVNNNVKYYISTGEKVWKHKRSLLCDKNEFVDGTKYLSYGTSMITGSHLIDELTPFSKYALILFSQRVDVDPVGNGIIVDKWTGLKCWPRVGILLQFLQQLFGILMERKFRDPSSNFIDHPVIQLVHDLIESDGRAHPVGMLA